MSALEFGTINFFRADSISSGLALLIAAKNLSTLEVVAAWEACTLAPRSSNEIASAKVDLPNLNFAVFTLESNLWYFSILYVWGDWGSNPGPTDYESVALTN